MIDIKRGIASLTPALSARITAAILAFFITVSGIKCFDVIKNGEKNEDKDKDQGGETVSGKEDDTPVNSAGEDSNKKLFSDENLVFVSSAFSAQTMIMCDLSSLKAIAAKEPEQKLGPGDLSSIMCAILVSKAIKAGQISIDDRVVCPAAAAKRPNYAMSSEIYSVGMRLKVGELLRCMLYQKGSSFAYSLSVHISGSEDAFVREMNDTAKKLGMNNTLFTNVCGEDDGTASITSYDAAVMMKYFLDDELLRGIFGSSEPVKIQKYDTSSSVYLTVSNDFYETTCTESQAKADGIKGGKTGICGFSQWTVVLFSNGKTEYLVLALNSPTPYADVLRMYSAYSQ